MMRLVPSKLARFWRGQAGNATVEFVIVFPVFLTLFLFSLELAIITLRHTMLERGLDIAWIRVGGLLEQAACLLKVAGVERRLRTFENHVHLIRHHITLLWCALEHDIHPAPGLALLRSTGRPPHLLHTRRLAPSIYRAKSRAGVAGHRGPRGTTVPQIRQFVLTRVGRLTAARTAPFRRDGRRDTVTGARR